jgi:hypothetical protein
MKHVLLAAVALGVIGCGSSSGVVAGGGTDGRASQSATTSRSNSPASPSDAAGQRVVHLAGRVYFTKVTGQDDESIFVLDGSRVRQLTDPGAACCDLRVSPTSGRLLVMPGGDPGQPVTGGTLSPAGKQFTRLTLTDPTLNLVPQAWSSDGKRIAFEGWQDGTPARTGVYTANAADGTGLRRVTVRPGDMHDIPLDYSPDGKQLVFYRSVGVDPDPYVGGSLWVVGVDGAEPHQVASTSAKPAPWARWSPDGTRIVFATERTADVGQIQSVGPDGSGLRRLFADPDGGFPIQPVWAPDGTQILFALDPTNDQFTHPTNALFVMESDGNNPRLVLAGHDHKRQPEWVR